MAYKRTLLSAPFMALQCNRFSSPLTQLSSSSFSSRPSSSLKLAYLLSRSPLSIVLILRYRLLSDGSSQDYLLGHRRCPGPQRPDEERRRSPNWQNRQATPPPNCTVGKRRERSSFDHEERCRYNLHHQERVHAAVPTKRLLFWNVRLPVHGRW